MKLEKYVDKNKKKRKIMLISISVILLISVSFLLYKTFASFTESAEFQVMKGQVDYFGNSDIYFTFYEGDKELEEMPQKGNKENLIFDHGECDNGASIIWDSEEWAPLVKNLSKSKTKCSLYFKEQVVEELGGMKIPLVESGDGLYEVEHKNLYNWSMTEYRYAGVNPNNYVKFNNEIWRIIGLVNVNIDNNPEQRIKIVRTNGMNIQKDFENYSWDYGTTSPYTNNWTTSKLKNMLNGIYYESGTGDCYKNSSATQCNFNSGIDLPKGLDNASRNMIDKEVIWNLGGYNTPYINVKEFYERERGISTGNNNEYPSEWNKETDVGEKYNGIGLIYPSDFGYAVGGEVRNNCLTESLASYDKKNCGVNDWLKPNNDVLWTMTPLSSGISDSFIIVSSGFVGQAPVYSAHVVWPTLYLKPTVKITDNPQSNKDYGSIDNPFILES